MANRDILKEAIADAKAVKETAIANAKIALEEAFTPFLQEKFAAKLAEIDEMEKNEDELSENKDDMNTCMKMTWKKTCTKTKILWTRLT